MRCWRPWRQAIAHPDGAARTEVSVLLLGGAALSLIGGLVYSAAPPHLWDAINIYNDEVQRVVPLPSPAPAPR